MSSDGVFLSDRMPHSPNIEHMSPFWFCNEGKNIWLSGLLYYLHKEDIAHVYIFWMFWFKKELMCYLSFSQMCNIINEPLKNVLATTFTPLSEKSEVLNWEALTANALKCLMTKCTYVFAPSIHRGTTGCSEQNLSKAFSIRCCEDNLRSIY